MKHYIGIDLHSNNHFVSVIDDNDNRLVEKRIKNDLSNTIKLLKPFKHSVEAIAIESTYNWYWLADGLIEQAQI